MLIYQDIKIPHLQIAHLGGNLEVGNIKIHLFYHKSDTMWSGWNAETYYGCLRGKIYTKLEVLSFEKARDEIERDKLFLLSPNTKMSPFPLSLIIVL